MSREIKFRAWDSDVERFVSGGFWINATTGNLQHLPSITVIQYTGLKDKNDVEIYEGDILIHEDFEHKKDKVVGVMEWDEKVAGFTRFYPLNKFEVIGNIFENPKLVKV